MKKYEYIKPMLTVSRFSTENIITDSGTPQQEYLTSLEDYQVKAQVSFDDLIKFEN